MAFIRPSADLRNNYNEISKICHRTMEPIYITKNGANDLVVLSDEAYENIIKISKETEESRVDKLVSKYFDKYYHSFEEFQKDILDKINESIKEINDGKEIPMEDIVAEMEARYGEKI